MNSTVLQKPEFVEKVNKAIENLKAYTVDVAAWEHFKARIKDAATGRREAAEYRANERRLTETLRGLIEADEEQPGEFRDDIRIIKTELRSELEGRYWGALVRSREQRVEFKAQPSKLFRAFERERTARKGINEIVHRGGVARGRDEGAAAFCDHFSQLFRSKPTPEWA